MAGTPAGLPAGVLLSDRISLGVIARAFPPDRVRQLLAETGKASARESDLRRGLVYYAIALALYMSRSTREVLRSCCRRCAGCEAPKRSSSRARAASRRPAPASGRRRCGVVWAGGRATRRAPARGRGIGLATVRLDGSCLEVADTEANRTAFGSPGASRGESAFPQLRFVALVGTGRMCCSAPAWAATPRGRRRWPMRCWRRCGLACCAWPTSSSSDMRSGAEPRRPAPSCSGGEAPSAAAARSSAGRRLLLDDHLPQRQGPAASHLRSPGARDRVPAGGHRRCRDALPLGHHDLGPGAGARGRTGRALPRALGHRGRPGRAENAVARGAGRLRSKTPELSAGDLGPAAGAFRRARADARAALRPTRTRTGCPSRTPCAWSAAGAAVRGASPLGQARLA